MFRAMKPETIAARDHRRDIERNADRAAFERNVEQAKVAYPQFAWPTALPDVNTLFLECEQGWRGPKGYSEAIAVSVHTIKYEPAF